jgi:membrane protease YdiL (CAAX protease family)
LFPVGHFLFLFITTTIVLFFSYSQIKIPEYRHPVVQTGFILFAIAIVFFWFLGQFPNPAISENQLTIAISSFIRLLSGFGVKKVLAIFKPVGLHADIIGNLSVGLRQLFVLVVIPAILLSPYFKKSNDFKIQRFNYWLMVIILLLYIPFVFTNEKPLIFLFPYFITYLLIAFSEEYLFRFLLQNRLESILKNKLNAIVLASLLFGIIHVPINSKMYGWPVSVAFCLGVNTFGGILYGYVFQKTRSLLLVTIVHAWSGTILM